MNVPLLPEPDEEASIGFPPARALVGRKTTVAAIVKAVHGGGKILTILGSPGIGKTTLAAAIGLRRPAVKKAWFCDLTDAQDASDLGRQLLRRLGRPGGTSAEVELRLSTLPPSLIVLDNFEQLTAHASTVSEWSRRCPHVVFLITSRERLAVEQEQVFDLDPLSVPETNADSAALATSEAVMMFRDYAQAVAAPPSNDLAAIGSIVRSLEGIPLAIELAAARTRVMSPTALALRLESGGDLSLSKRSPRRHRTLSAAIESSWSQLDDTERRLLQCCAVFSNGFSAAMLEAVMQQDARESDIVETLAQLRDKSLVRAFDTHRLGLFKSIRDFVARKGDPDLMAEFAQRHRQTFARLGWALARTRLALSSEADSGLTADTMPDRHNLKSAQLRHRCLVDEPPVEAVSTQAGLLAALFMLDALSFQDAEVAFKQVEPHLGALESHQRSLLKLAWFRQLFHQRLHQDALSQMAALAEDAAERSDIRVAAWVHSAIGWRSLGDAPEALRCHQRAGALISEEATGSPAVPNMDLLAVLNRVCVGRLHGDLKQHDLSIAENESAVADFQRMGLWWFAALGLGNLAQIAQERGDFERAESLLGRAIDQFRTSNKAHYEQTYAIICGGLYLEWGKLDHAESWFDTAVNTTNDSPYHLHRAILHGSRAVLAARQHDREGARLHLELARANALSDGGALGDLLMRAYACTTNVLAPAPTSKANVGAGSEANGTDAGTATTRAYTCLKALQAKPSAQNLDARFALRLLEGALRDTSLTSKVATKLTVDDDARFVVGEGTTVDLSTRAALRRIFAALCEHHLTAPGVPLDVYRLATQGWPGEHIQSEAASLRVRVSIAALRKMGLKGIVITRDRGYLIDPKVEVSRTGSLVP